MATKVKMSTAIPKMSQHKTAVNMISRALAKVLRIELSFCRNNAVVIPMAALFNAMAKTLPWEIDAMLSLVKASDKVPLNQRIPMLQKMESKYMKTF